MLARSLAPPAGVDVLLNKESNRETPSVVTFTSKQRMLGTDAGACVRRAGGAPVYMYTPLLPPALPAPR